jgi:hypothetical protein
MIHAGPEFNQNRPFELPAPVPSWSKVRADIQKDLTIMKMRNYFNEGPVFLLSRRASTRGG